MRDKATIAGKQADISLLRIAATVGVVLTHTCDATAELHRALLPAGQMVFYRAVARFFWWHVPVFFMITGALFLSRERTLKAADCVMKYARRIVLALVIYGIPFALLELMFDQKTLTLAMVGQAALNTLNGQNWAHLWYLYSLVGIYLLLPLFKHFTDTASRREKRYLLLMLFIFKFCFPFVDLVAGTNIGFSLPVTYPVFYLLLGNYLSEKIPGFLRNRKLCACVLCLYALFAPVNHSLNMAENALMEYTSPLTAAAACCAFCLFRGGISVPEKWTGTVWKLDRLCFGVYLVHPVFINFVYKFIGVSPASFRLYPFATVLFFAGFTVVSFLASWVMSLIPPLKKYIL